MSDMVTFKEIKKDDEIAKNYLKLIKEATQKSNALPNHGEDFDFISSFEEFQDLSSNLGSKILNLMQEIIKRNKLRGNLGATDALMSLDEKFDILVDVNDQFFEKIGIKIDEGMGLKKDASLVAVSRTPKIKTSLSYINTAPKSFAYSLLTARNISRPQQYFRDKIDNSINAFYPKLKSKPNAIVSFEESIIICQKDNKNNCENLGYDHPYRAELEKHDVDPSFLLVNDPKPPKNVEEITLSFIKDENQLNELCTKLESFNEIAVDLEAHSFRSYQGFTCLMQISTREEDYIIDTLALRHIIYKLNDIFTNPAILKVFHGADLDIVWLQRDFGIYVVNMFDTHQASRALNLQHNSLAYLLKHYCNKDVCKKYQLADWRIRPLPSELLTYAREDTQFLLYIYDCMKKDLVQRSSGTFDLLKTVFHKSNDICKRTYEKSQLHETSFREMFFTSQSKNSLKTILNGQQLEALKNLYSWRDRIARLEDESCGYVLPNHMLLQIAEHLPKEPEGILACCKPIPPLVKRELFEIHQIILKSRNPTLLIEKSSKVKIPNPTNIQHPKFYASLSSPHDFSHTLEDCFDNNGEGDNCYVGFDDSILKKNPIIRFSTHKKLIKDESKLNIFENPIIKFLPASLLKRVYTRIKINESKEIGKWKFLPQTKIPEPSTISIPIPEVQVPVKIDKTTIDMENLEVIQSIREQMNKKPKADKTDKIINEIKQKKQKNKRKNLDIHPFEYKKINLDKEIIDEKINKKNKKSMKRKEAINPHSIEESDYKPARKKYIGSNNRCMSYNKSSLKNYFVKAQWPDS